MVDLEPSDDAGADFGIAFPPNARLASLEFRPGELRVQLDDGGSERIVPAALISAIHGARIRREALHRAPSESSIMERFLGKESVAIEENFQVVVALRVASVGELWYLIADTFNFRKPLGAEATYVLDHNLRLLVRKLAAFAPQAVQDGFVAALLSGLALPPPLDGLMEFFRIASR